MVKNKKGGSSHKKMASKNFKKEFDPRNVPLPVNKVDEKTYLGIVTAPKGDKRFTFNIIINNIKHDDEKHFHLAGNVRKRVNRDTLVLVSERLSIKADTYDGIYVYSDKKEILHLISKGYITNDLASSTIAYSNTPDETTVNKDRQSFNDEDFLPPAYDDYDSEDNISNQEEIEEEDNEDITPEEKTILPEDEKRRRRFLKNMEKSRRKQNAKIKYENIESETSIDGNISIIDRTVNEEDETINIDDI